MRKIHSLAHIGRPGSLAVQDLLLETAVTLTSIWFVCLELLVGAAPQRWCACSGREREICHATT